MIIDTQQEMPMGQFWAIMSVVYVLFIVVAVWALGGGKRIRRWWRRRNLNIPKEEENVRTITGPLWDINWVKVSETTEKRPEEVSSTVLGNDLPEAMQLLRAKFGDEFNEKNVRRAMVRILPGHPSGKNPL